MLTILNNFLPLYVFMSVSLLLLERSNDGDNKFLSPKIGDADFRPSFLSRNDGDNKFLCSNGDIDCSEFPVGEYSSLLLDDGLFIFNFTGVNAFFVTLDGDEVNTIFILLWVIIPSFSSFKAVSS